MAYFLVAPSGHFVGVPPRVVCVGSDPSADIPIMANIGLAPRHFALVPGGRGCRLQALAPNALLKVNGRMVQAHDLAIGDQIQAGALSLRFQDTPELTSEPVMPPELSAPPPHLLDTESLIQAPAPHADRG